MYVEIFLLIYFFVYISGAGYSFIPRTVFCREWTINANV